MSCTNAKYLQALLHKILKVFVLLDVFLHKILSERAMIKLKPIITKCVIKCRFVNSQI